MSNNPNKMAFLRQRKYVSAQAIQANIADAGVGPGAPVFQEVEALGISGYLMDTAGDAVNHYMLIPTNWDRGHKIFVRAHFLTASGTAADTITWKFLYQEIVPGTTVMLAQPVTALDTVLVAQAVAGVDSTVERTSTPGEIAGGTIADATLAIKWQMEMDAFAAGLTEAKYLLGVEFEFSPRFGRLQNQGESKPWAPS